MPRAYGSFLFKQTGITGHNFDVSIPGWNNPGKVKKLLVRGELCLVMALGGS